MKKYEKIIYSLISIGGFVLVWSLLTAYTSVGKTTPGPVEVIKFITENTNKNIGEYTIIGHVLISVKRVLVGFSVGSILGIVTGIMMGISPSARAIIAPYFEMFRQIPPIAWIPMAILWFGIGELPKYFIIFIGTFVNVTLNAFEGAKNVDPTLIGAARLLGSNDRDLFTHIIVPSSIPYIFNGMQVGFSVSWMGVLAAEMVSSYAGIGWLIIRGSDTGNMAQVIGGMVCIALTGLFMSAIMRYFEGRLTAWNK